MRLVRLLDPHELPLIAEATTHGQVDRITALLILVRMQVAPIAAIPVKVDQGANRARSKEFRHPVDHRTASRRPLEDIVVDNANRPRELHPGVKPLLAKIQLLHEPVENIAVVRLAQQARDEEGLVLEGCGIGVGPNVALGDAIAHIHRQRRQERRQRYRLRRPAALRRLGNARRAARSKRKPLRRRATTSRRGHGRQEIEGRAPTPNPKRRTRDR
mmetsp:Transcript_34253/g.99483  ORF Transcript_34253/g.99483 Transcript_34253/m.99483 type:complete len:216 (-) Transcript_34253:11-658(-)